MKVLIDEQKCQGHGRCYATAPELFAPSDDFGHAEAVGGGVLPDDPDILARATRAAAACPERAITIETTTCEAGPRGVGVPTSPAMSRQAKSHVTGGLQ